MTAVSVSPITLTVPDVSPAGLKALTAEVAATAEHYDRSGDIPVAGLEAAHRGGYLTASVAARFGGPELGPFEIVKIIEPRLATRAGSAALASSR